MKPSERIREIMGKGNTTLDGAVAGIIKYLDEQWEKLVKGSKTLIIPPDFLQEHPEKEKKCTFYGKNENHNLVHVVGATPEKEGKWDGKSGIDHKQYFKENPIEKEEKCDFPKECEHGNTGRCDECRASKIYPLAYKNGRTILKEEVLQLIEEMNCSEKEYPALCRLSDKIKTL